MSTINLTINSTMSIHISSLLLGKMNNLIHLLTDTDTKQSMVVDPAWDFERIKKNLIQQDTTITGVLLTHTHHDHVSALPDLLNQYHIPVYVSEREMELGMLQLTDYEKISDGDLITLGKSQITVIETPGHTLGSICFYTKGMLVAGDTLFIDSCGRCNFKESDVNAMWNSLQRLKQLPDETIIYVGHDYGEKQTDTLGNQKRTNPYLLIDDKDFFIDFRMHLQSQYRRIPFSPCSATEILSIAKVHKN